MPFFHRTPLWYALGLALLGIDAQAQALPDAGQVLDSVEQRRPALPAPAAIDLDLPPTPTPPAHDDGPAMDVQGFVIEGNSAIATSDLQALLQALEGQSLTVSQLEAGAARITRLYRERGYPFAYAYLPEQTVEAGLVRIAVLEGRLGEVRVENATRQRANVIDAPLTRLEHGQVIRADALESS
ncbi:MAG: POTRA domain-containing protein, partial [Comamonas sp.]